MSRWVAFMAVGLVCTTPADAFDPPSAPFSDQARSSRNAVEQGVAVDLNVLGPIGAPPRALSARFGDRLHVRDFGAICDGRTHPLSSLYKSLAAAQAVYPEATALSEEVDGAAISQALTVRSALGGGNVEISSGTCLLSKGIRMPGGSTNPAVRLVGQGRSSILQPAASMGALITVAVGSVDIESVALQNASNYATIGIDINKPVDNSPVRVLNNRIQGFPLAISLVGDNVDIGSNYFLINGKLLQGNKCLNIRFRSNYQFGGDGLDFPVGTQQCEGVSVVQNILLPGRSGTFIVRIRSGLQFDFTDNVFDQATDGPGVILDGTSAPVNLVTFKGGWIGAQGRATGQTDGIQILGGVRNVVLAGLTLRGWRGYDVNVQSSSHLAMTDLRAFSEHSLGSLYLNNANATSITGGAFSSPTASIIEAGSTTTRATGAYFTAPPRTNAGSQYINNFGDTFRELEVTGQRGGARLAVTGGSTSVQVTTAGTGADITATLASKGAAPVQIAPGGSGGVAVFRQGSVGLLRPVLDQSKVRAMAAGTALGVPATTSWYAMVQKGTVASQTLTLPTATGDGHLLRISTVGAVTALTLTPQSGDTVGWTAGATLAANSGIMLGYDQISKAWLRVQ